MRPPAKRSNSRRRPVPTLSVLAVRTVLPAVLQRAQALVLDADALNIISTDGALQQALTARSARQRPTVLTPHPLEAARLLHTTSVQVQAHRLMAARELAKKFQCTVVLKGSGTVIAHPDDIPHINPTVNGRLATAGTGDVLAGLIGAGLAAGMTPLQAAIRAVFVHGEVADAWPLDEPLTAGALARTALSSHACTGFKSVVVCVTRFLLRTELGRVTCGRSHIVEFEDPLPLRQPPLLVLGEPMVGGRCIQPPVHY